MSEILAHWISVEYPMILCVLPTSSRTEAVVMGVGPQGKHSAAMGPALMGFHPKSFIRKNTSEDT